jgi:hypothetical protein
MSADRAAHDDKTPPAAADQGDGRAGQDTGRPAGPGEARGQRRAETRTREEYAEAMRAGTAQGQRAGGRRPETVTFENKEIEVTREAADGVWVEGLPGEPPTRIGDLLSSSEDPARSRADKLRKELDKEAEGITDTGGKVADLIQEILDNPQPTHSMTHSRGPEMATSGTEHGISAGHGVEAMLTLSIVGAAAVHKICERWRKAQEQ